MIKVSVDVRPLVKQMGALKDTVQDKAIKRSLNECVKKGKTAMSKEIRDEYRISAAKVRERLSTRSAYVDGTFKFAAELKGGNGRKRAMNIIYFAERNILAPSLKEARARRKAGTLGRVFVQVKKSGGKKPLGRTAFIGNKGRTVFERIGKSRLPIRGIATGDVPQMFNQKKINKAVTAVMLRDFNVIFERNLKFYAAKSST